MARPLPTFHDFVGQRGVVRRLQLQGAGAKRLNEPQPHTLMSGPSGLGKTLLAQAMASEYGTQIYRVHGGEPLKAIIDKFTKLKHADFLFVDEAQAMRVETQEMLLDAIDELRVPNLAARKEDAKKSASASMTTTTPAEEVDSYLTIEAFSLTLATNRPGELCDALLKRIEVQVSLDYYTAAEMEAITDRLAAGNQLLITSQARNLVAKTANGIPRVARHMIRNIRRHFSATGARKLEVSDIREFLMAMEIDESGLDAMHRRYLDFLAREVSASLESLKLLLGSDELYVRNHIESLLQRKRLIRIGNGGRELTDLGREYLTANAGQQSKEY